jgi:hypothetical protein
MVTSATVRNPNAITPTMKKRSSIGPPCRRFVARIETKVGD